MPQPIAVINIVALSKVLIGDHMPHLKRFSESHGVQKLIPPLPAVTTTSQSSMLTGKMPADHGVVANGWYNREASEIQFWKQSNKLVQGEKVWETARRQDSNVSSMNMFWWYNMYSSTDYAVTPRPIYKADGRKLPDCYSQPASLRDELQAQFGQFPLFHFWGPKTSIKASQWIADASQYVWEKVQPTLSFIYLPHLDYGLQKYGMDLNHPQIQKDLSEIDKVVGELMAFMDAKGVKLILLSEYAIETVDLAIDLNRFIRKEGWLTVREEEGLELLDAGACQVFAVCDHQLAHVYLHEKYLEDESFRQRVKEFLEGIDGVDAVLAENEKREAGLNHPRSGDFVLVAREGAWFSYPYWLDDTKAPDFARTVDIHRKPGYDPAELFVDPNLKVPNLKVAWRLFQKKLLKQRALMDVIPLDASLVKGSHGRVYTRGDNYPVIMSNLEAFDPRKEIHACQVHDLILEGLSIAS